MYVTIPSETVGRGIFAGFKCPISGKEFLSDDGRGDTKKRLYQDQQDHTAALMAEMDGGQYQGRDIASYRVQYADFLAKKEAAQQ